MHAPDAAAQPDPHAPSGGGRFASGPAQAGGADHRIAADAAGDGAPEAVAA
jgi:hypothetical protein